MVLDSHDPKVQEDMMAGVPFDEIELPSHGLPLEEEREWSIEDLEVIDYLRHHHFSLPQRMKCVQESIERLKPVVETESVSCAACGGELE